MNAPFRNPIAEAMPSLLIDEAWPHLRKMAAYLEVMHQLAEIEDEVGFIVNGRKMIIEAREVGRRLKLMAERFDNPGDSVPAWAGDTDHEDNST